MTIFGIGTDIVEIARIEKLMKKFGSRFFTRVFSENEIKNNNLFYRKPETIAGYFSVKESFSKAIGTGIGKFFSLKEIEIFKNNFSKPNIFLTGKNLKNFTELISHQNYKIHCSISHEKFYSISNVLIELL